MTEETSVLAIELSKGFSTLVDPEDFEWASQWSWCALVEPTRVCARRNPTKTKTLYLHREILSRMLGRPLQREEEVDHRNGDPLDNRRQNIRVANRTTQMQNRRGWGKSKYKGVRLVKGGKWEARIRVNKELFSLGRFKSEREAGYIYNEAALKYFGEFARLNQVFANDHP